MSTTRFSRPVRAVVTVAAVVVLGVGVAGLVVADGPAGIVVGLANCVVAVAGLAAVWRRGGPGGR